MNVFCWSLLFFSLLAGTAIAQSPTPAPDPAQQGQVEGSPAESDAQPAPRQRRRPWSIFTLVNNAIDTNIHHDLDNLQAYGLVFGTGVQYQNDPVDPSVTLVYQTAVHRYTATDRWDRLSHNLRGSFEQDLSGPWKVEALGEISLQGTSEDRELTNQFILLPRLSLRVGDRNRVRFYGAYRLKRDEENTERDATNRYIGAEFTERGERGKRWDLGLRYEVNAARGLRYQYDRWTYNADFATPVGPRDRMEVELKLRLQRYRHRFVEVDDQDVLRRDLRWIPAVTWVRSISPHLELHVGYTFETRSSNDPERDFSAHLLTTSWTRRW